MKIKLSNYVAQFLVEHGIDTVFTVTGGGAMHLNDFTVSISTMSRHVPSQGRHMRECIIKSALFV